MVLLIRRLVSYSYVVQLIEHPQRCSNYPTSGCSKVLSFCLTDEHAYNIWSSPVMDFLPQDQGDLLC